MEATAVPESIAAIKSPFQIFSAFTEKDKEKFFGREKETRQLYQRIQEANVVLVYGESGTGKTSIVQCGLLNETKHFNWTSITIRRIDNINDTLLLQLNSAIKNEAAKGSQLSITEKMQEVFMGNFQPVLLVFDQFEEIFVYGDEKERYALLENIRQISAMRIPWKMVFVIREDFLAQLDEFEKKIPGLFKKRLRIELMNKSNCREVIIKSCGIFNIDLVPLRNNEKEQTDMIYSETVPDTPDAIINTVCDSKNAIHLPYFQVFLDKLWKEAWALNSSHIKMDDALVQKVGNMGNVLKAFLEEKVNAQTIISAVDAWRFLKLFVPEKGTTRKKINLKEYSAIPEKTLDDVVIYFAEYKILTGCAVNNYELAHESLVPIIQRVQLNEIRPRLTVPTIIGNPYKGLASFDQSDSYRFYGRKEAVETVYEKIKLLDFVVIVGNSGAGKSSLIKAGLFPRLISDGYKILPVVKAGDSPVAALNNSFSEAEKDVENKKFILLIDQYEELNTRISQNQTREDVYNWIANRLEKQKAEPSGIMIKIIATIRADFEPQFSVKPQLATYWKLGKYIIPPFTREEIREVIEEPAYQAGLEFSPPSLVEKIAEEVYSSQSTGLLPLMSFTLKELYNKYELRGNKDNLLREDDYTELGGVIGGLQNRAQYIFDRFKIDFPGNYQQRETIMQNIILRMIYLSTGEIAGQRVLKEKFIYTNDGTNQITSSILNSLIDSHLIIAGKNNKEQEYYEPAHDVFIRSWGQIWDWINVTGKDKLSMRSRLTQAADEYYANNQKTELLWDNKLTDGLLRDMEAENTWLNKKEYEFVTVSIKKKEDAAALLRRIEEEKLQEQKEKEQLREEKIVYQRNRLKASRAFVTVVLILLIIAVGMFVWANRERREAVKYSKQADENLVSATKSKAEIDLLNQSLADTVKILKTNRIELIKKSDSLEKQTKELRAKTLLVTEALFKANTEEQKAKNAATYANAERVKANNATKRSVLLSDSLRISLAEIKKAKAYSDSISDITNAINLVLNKTIDSLNSAQNALTVQKQKNLSQLLNLSKRFELTDMVKAYRIAEHIYQKDSLDTDTTGHNPTIAAQYKRLLNQSAFFYTKQFTGSFSKVSPDGNYILNTMPDQQSVALLRNETFDSLGTIPVGADLITADFSPSSQNIFLIYKNKIEVSAVNHPGGKVILTIKEKEIIAARLSADQERLLVGSIDHFTVYPQKPIGGELPKSFSGDFGKAKISNAVFSSDGKRVIASSEVGKVGIWDVLTGKQIIDVVPLKNILNTYLSPDGNYFITTTPDKLYLYNGQGKLIDDKETQYKYGRLNSATFSQDGQQVLLSFSFSANIKERLSNSKMEGNNSISLQLMNINTKTKMTDVTDKISADDLYLFARIAPNILLEGDMLLYSFGYGLIKSVNLKSGAIKLLPGHTKYINTMSILNGSSKIMTSAADNTTKIWWYDTPKNLAAAGLLPKLSEDDLKSFGLDK